MLVRVCVGCEEDCSPPKKIVAQAGMLAFGLGSCSGPEPLARRSMRALRLGLGRPAPKAAASLALATIPM